MLASIFITLLISFLLLRHKRKAREAQLLKDEKGKERASVIQRPPTSSLPIAASMSKRDANPHIQPTAPTQQREEEIQARNPNPEMAAARSFSAFHPDNEEAFAGALRDRLIRLSSQQPSLVPGPQNRVYIPPSPPSPPSPLSVSAPAVQQTKQVSFSTIRAVENNPAPLSEGEDEGEGFTVSRTLSTKSKEKGKEKEEGVRIGVRTWVESDSS